jgi:hypothetical protein
VAVLGLARSVGLAGVDREYGASSRGVVPGPHPLDAFNRYSNLYGYYAHNLRAARTYSIWLLDSDPERRAQVVEYAAASWRRWTDHHGNAWFSWLWFVMSGTPPDAEGLRAALRAALEADPVVVVPARRPLVAAAPRRGDVRHHARLGDPGLSPQAGGVFHLAEGSVERR